MEDKFFTIKVGWAGGLGMILHLVCTLLLLLLISSTSVRQVLDPRVWGPLVHNNELVSFIIFLGRMILSTFSALGKKTGKDGL